MIKVTRRAFLAGTTTLAAAGMLPLGVRAATPKNYRALLVACTDYPILPQKHWLIGPKNDAALVRVGNAAGNGGLVEIQARKIAGVGGVAQAQVDAARAMVHGGFQGGQAAGGADEFERGGVGGGGWRLGRGRGVHFLGVQGRPPECGARHWTRP